jgi:hypothetical protein
LHAQRTEGEYNSWQARFKVSQSHASAAKAPMPLCHYSCE